MNQIMHPIEPEELMAYLDGELTAARASAAAAHLSDCAECQRHVAELRDLSQDLRAWKVEAPEPAMPTAIAMALRGHQGTSRRIVPARIRWREILGRRWRTFAWAGGLAAVLLVMATIPLCRRGDRLTQYVVADKDIGPLPLGLGDGVSHGVVSSAPAAPSTPPAAGPVSAKKSFQAQSSYSEAAAQRRTREQRTEMAASLESQTDGDAALSTDHNAAVSHGPMIIRTAELSVITKEFDKARGQLETILKRHRGYVGELRANDTTGSGRTLTATLRVPADQLDTTLAEVKTLGRVESESQSGQDVTSQYVDLQARLSNARNTEQRLTDLLRNRTGKLSDVLEVEQELDRVRGQVEQMEAERKNMANQVSFASLNATITEDYKAELQVVPPSTSTRLSNAAVEGYRSIVDGVVSLVLFVLSTGPSLLLWGAILFLPARMVWKRVRRSFAS